MNFFLGVLNKAIMVAALFSVCRAEGRVFVVTDTNDTTRTNSLRGAVMLANRSGGNNTIILGQISRQSRNDPQHQWIYRLTISGADEDNALTGDLDITRGELTIIGTVPNVTIDATGLGDRAFQIFPHARLTLSNLTIKGGNAPKGSYGSFGYGEAGGAIFNSGTLIIQNCAFVKNASGDGGYTGSTYLFSSPGGSGGGIYNEGSAQLSGCIVRDNITGNGAGPDGFGFASIGGNGGGIYNSGKMTLINCIISDNLNGQGGAGGVPSIGMIPINEPGMSGGDGGGGAGIFNAGKMTLNFCTLDDNVAGTGGIGGSGGGAGGNGGGIFNAGTLILSTCTVSDNAAGVGGTGGNSSYWTSGTGGNGGNGGGIYSSGLLNLTSCTIALNGAGAGGNGGNSYDSASAVAGGQGGDGGGILNEASNTNAIVRNTLIALNTPNVGGMGGTNFDYFAGETIGYAGSNGFGFDIVGDFTPQGFDLIGMADGSAGFANGVSADQVGSNANPIDPLLGPLLMNGGPTPTHALLTNSPAIDQGNCFGIRTDQRGYPRPKKFRSIPNGPGGDGSDIGAFEFGSRPTDHAGK